MLTLLGALMTIKKRAWVMHWNSKGPNAYGDHLLFERIYTQMDDNIDALGERIVAFIGPVPYDEVMNFSQRPGLVSDNSVYSLRALVDLMAQVQELSSKIRTSYQVNAGLDDYLMALNNSLDTFIYLLQQRLR
jgi:DNA-binding ferritin-like protein